MPAPSLKSLATAACIINIKRIDDLGDQPSYRILRPVLTKLENPSQLRTLEQNSPWLANDSAELWRAFIKRDISNWQDKIVEPKNPTLWWKVYRKLKREADAEVAQQSEALKAALKGREDDRKKNTIQLMSVADAPRVRGAQRPQAYTNLAKGGNTASLAFNSGSKTKVTTGRGVMERARREAKEHSLFSGKNRLATPTHLLGVGQKQNQVLRVPKSMVGSNTTSTAPTAPQSKAQDKPPWLSNETKRTTTIGPPTSGSPSSVLRNSDMPRASTETTSTPAINLEGVADAPAHSGLSADRPRTASPSRRLGISPSPSPRPVKRSAPSIFMPADKRRRP